MKTENIPENPFGKQYSTISDALIDPANPQYLDALEHLTANAIRLYLATSIIHRETAAYAFTLSDVEPFAKSYGRKWKKYFYELIEAELIFVNEDGSYTNVEFVMVHEQYIRRTYSRITSRKKREAKPPRPTWLPTPGQEQKTETPQTPQTPQTPENMENHMETREAVREPEMVTREPARQENPAHRVPRQTVNRAEKTMLTEDILNLPNRGQTVETRDAKLEYILHRYNTETEREKKSRLERQKSFSSLTLAQQEDEER